MGYYVTVLNCSDDEGCESHWWSLDGPDGLPTYKLCRKHSVVAGNTVCYNLRRFCQRFGEVIDNSYVVNALVLETFSLTQNGKTRTCVKLRIGPESISFLKTNLKRNIYYSSFNDEPAWKWENNMLYIIDLVDDDMFSPPSCCRCSDKLCYNYRTRKQEPIGIQEPV